MIWFACKRCGKRNGRDGAQAGSLVFCDCGEANRVPWTSAPEAEPAEKVPSPPVLNALPARPAPPADLPLPSRRPGRLIGKVHPDFCFQHDEAATEATCDACRLPFCSACVVTLQGQTLCGPCKNFRAAGLGRPLRVPPLAVVALVVSLSSGPVALILSLAGYGVFLGEGLVGIAVVMCLLGAALPVAGVVLAGKALRRIEARPNAGGRGMAASGACAALAGVVWCAGVAVVIVGRLVMD